MFMRDAYRDMVALEGEEACITSHDASESAIVRGMYDRRNVTGDIRGAEVRDSDYQIGVVGDDLPDWVRPGCRVDIRADVLHITALEHDGQGLTYLVCRVAP